MSLPSDGGAGAFPVLQTPRCLLRNINAGDAANIYKGLSDPAVIRYYGVSYSRPEAVEEQMRFYRELLQQQTGI